MAWVIILLFFLGLVGGLVWRGEKGNTLIFFFRQGTPPFSKKKPCVYGKKGEKKSVGCVCSWLVTFPSPCLPCHARFPFKNKSLDVRQNCRPGIGLSLMNAMHQASWAPGFAGRQSSQTNWCMEGEAAAELHLACSCTWLPRGTHAVFFPLFLLFSGWLWQLKPNLRRIFHLYSVAMLLKK